jgi:hypothetical protein
MSEATNWAIISQATNIVENVCYWDGVTPWVPPEGTYVVQIGDSGAGVGWPYNPTTQLWTLPPDITASFAPMPISISQDTTLSWSSNNSSYVEISTDAGISFPTNGSKIYAPSSPGKFSVTLTAHGLAGTAQTVATITVLRKQRKLSRE